MLQAIETLKPLVQREPTWAKPRFFLGDCYRTLAKSHDEEGRFPEALPYWELGIALAKGEPREEFRSCQTLDLARLGEHRKAWEAVRSLEPSLPAPSHSGLHSILTHATMATAIADGSCRPRPCRR